MNNEHPCGDVYSAGKVSGFAVKDAERHIGTGCGVFCTRHQVIAHPVVGNHLNHQQQQEGTGYPGAPFIEGECGTNLRFGTAKFFAHRKSALGRVFCPVC